MAKQKDLLFEKVQVMQLGSALAISMSSPMQHNAEGVMAWSKHDFESSVRPELAILYRVARRLARSDDEASDLVQQTLVKAFQAWGRFDGRYLRSWLIQIMRNENLMRIRSSGKMEEVELDEAIAVDEPFWDEVHWRAQVGRVLQELDALPVEFRIAVTLCDLEQMTYEEAAKAMDVPIGTVRSRLSRGRSMLRARLTEGLE